MGLCKVTFRTKNKKDIAVFKKALESLFGTIWDEDILQDRNNPEIWFTFFSFNVKEAPKSDT